MHVLNCIRGGDKRPRKENKGTTGGQGQGEMGSTASFSPPHPTAAPGLPRAADVFMHTG